MDPKPKSNPPAAADKAAGSTVPPNDAARGTQPSAKPGTPVPQQFGRYRLQKKLGQGGMGAVFLAHDTQLDRPVALKIPQFSATNTTARERFLREARSAATLNHRNICPVYDVGEFQGFQYLTMAYIEGQALEESIRPEDPLPVHESCILVRKLALALQEAHDKGIIHRDLKPANVMIDTRGEPVLMDFGLAGRTTPGDSRLTQSGAVMGTPAYMSPEQVTGDIRAMGPATDVYSLGVILYELLTCNRPFEGPTAMVLGLIMVAEPEAPGKLRPGLPAALEAVVRKAMARKIEDRFASMKDFAEALAPFCDPAAVTAVQRGAVTQRVKGSATIAATPTLPATSAAAKKPTRRLPWLVGGAAVLLLGLVALCLAGAVVLRLQTSAGTVILEIDQKDVDVFVDGDKITITPKGGDAITVEARQGKHQLRVSKKGFEAWTDEITFKPGEAERIKISLKPLLAKGPDPKKDGATDKKGGGNGGKTDTKIDPKTDVKTDPKTDPKKEPKSAADTAALFNGKDLDGWEGLAGLWAVSKSGEIVGSTLGKAKPATNTFLCTRKVYRDFELKVEVKLDNDAGNSGIQIRSKVVNAGAFQVFGPQVEVAPTNAGGLYDEGGVGWLHKGAATPKTWLANDYNAFHVRCVGQHVTIKVNGFVTVDQDFPDLPAEGIIALQIHKGEPMQVRFRNFEFIDLSAAPGPIFTPLFNGKDLAGWKAAPGDTNTWDVKDGAIYSPGGRGHLFFLARDDYKDFHLIVEAKVNAPGNGGVYFRAAYASGFPKGYEAQVENDPQSKELQKTGSLYGFQAVNELLVKPGEWFKMDVIARGNHIVIKVNGKTVVDFVDAKNTYTRGHIALQENMPGAPIWYRRVEIREFPPGQ